MFVLTFEKRTDGRTDGRVGGWMWMDAWIDKSIDRDFLLKTFSVYCRTPQKQISDWNYWPVFNLLILLFCYFSVEINRLSKQVLPACSRPGWYFIAMVPARGTHQQILKADVALKSVRFLSMCRTVLFCLDPRLTEASRSAYIPCGQEVNWKLFYLLI